MSQLSTRLRILIIAIGVCVALSPFLFNSLNPYTDEGVTSPSNMLQLEAPPFMRGVEAAPLSQNSNFDYGHFSEVAGIAAYTQVELTADDLDTLANADLITVVDRKEDYVAGTMTALGYEDFPLPIIESMDIQIYVDTNGWVVAYLQKDQPASTIINWLQFGPTSITLENEAREVVEGILNKQVGEIFFYHFQHTSATGLFIAGDVARSENSEYTDTFTITIPDNFSIKESSWSHMIDKVRSSDCGIQSQKPFSDNFTNSNGLSINRSQIIPRLSQGAHTFEMTKLRTSDGPVYCGIVLIYEEGGN